MIKRLFYEVGMRMSLEEKIKALGLIRQKEDILIRSDRWRAFAQRTLTSCSPPLLRSRNLQHVGNSCPGCCTVGRTTWARLRARRKSLRLVGLEMEVGRGRSPQLRLPWVWLRVTPWRSYRRPAGGWWQKSQHSGSSLPFDLCLFSHCLFILRRWERRSGSVT